MTRRQARNARTTLTAWLLTSIAANLLQPTHAPQDIVATFLVCLFIALSLGAIYRGVIPRLRGLPLWAAAGGTGLAMFAAVAFSFALFVWLFVAFQTRHAFGRDTFEVVGRNLARPGLRTGVAYACGLVLATTFVLELARRLGPQRIGSLLLGRYRNPREEIRTFLLIDLRDSTPTAERLGAVRFSALLRDLFRDLTEPVVDAGGEVVGYVGDEAIVSWPARRDPAEAVRCFAALRARLAARAPEYERRYGTAPRIKGAVHRGPVVVTEVGELRTDVAFLGDALNTASRILDECGPLKADLLISGPTAEGLPPLPGMILEPLGAFPLRGKGEPLGLARAVFG